MTTLDNFFFVPSLARNHSGVDIVRSRIAVSATLHVPYRVLRLASAMTRRVYCWFFVSLTNSRNVICPLALRSLKTLRALNLGKNKRAVFYEQLLSEPREEPYLSLIVVSCCPCCRFFSFFRALRGTLLLSLVVYCCPSCRFFSSFRAPRGTLFVVNCCLMLSLLSFYPLFSEPCEESIRVNS